MPLEFWGEFGINPRHIKCPIFPRRAEYLPRHVSTRCYTPEAAPQTGQQQREVLLYIAPHTTHRQRSQERTGAAHAQRRTSRPAPAETPPGGPAGTHSARTAAARLQIANASPIPSTSPNGSADARRPPGTPPRWTRSTATEDIRHGPQDAASPATLDNGPSE